MPEAESQLIARDWAAAAFTEAGRWVAAGPWATTHPDRRSDDTGETT
ncbi:hypothetical protein ABGB20_13125 [Streptomyces sp. B22F1]